MVEPLANVVVDLALDGLQHLGERAEVGRIEIKVALQLAEERFAHLGVGLTAPDRRR